MVDYETYLQKFMIERVKKFEKTPVKNDVLDVYIDFYKNQNHKLPENQRISLIHIVNQLITFYFGGTDSTSVTIGLMLYFLALYPNYQTLIREEIS